MSNYNVTVDLSIALNHTDQAADVEPSFSIFDLEVEATNPVTAAANAIQGIFENYDHVNGTKISIYTLEKNVVSVTVKKLID